MFFQQLLNGLTNGSIYAVMAVGVTMIYKSLGMLNFAHGDTLMVGTFICLTLVNAGVPLYLAILISVFATVLLGFILERGLYRQVEFSSFTNVLIATVGVSYVLRNTSIVVWGTSPKLFPSLFRPSPLNILGYKVMPQSIGIILIALGIVTLLQLFYSKVKVGKCIRLAASDPEGAAMMGINVSHMRFLTFGISAGLAAIAGLLLAPLSFARVDMSVTIGMKAFAAAILGGIGNLWGALLGGIILGSVEAMGATYISTAYKDAFSFILLFLVLYFKPTGLLAKRIENKL